MPLPTTSEVRSEIARRAADELARRKARTDFHAYIAYTKKDYSPSYFSRTVCAALDRFIIDVYAGKRPILILQGPPQHGKSEIVSRKLPSYMMGKFPDLRIAGASYNDDLAKEMAQAVRRNLASEEHLAVFPNVAGKRKYDKDTSGSFTSPGGTGSYLGVGRNCGLTGKPVDIFICDDPIKGAKEALSPTVKDGVWSWYQAEAKTRLSKNSGQIIMATSWAEDDLSGRIMAQHKGDPRLTILKFPAINDPNETGFNPQLPLGPLVPELHPLEQLLEMKKEMSEYFWSALMQQSPKSIGGNVFKESGIRYYLPKELPVKFDQVIASWDCTFKDTDGSDFVVGQVWGKKGADVYLLDQVRERMTFTATLSSITELHDKFPNARKILIEDKANGPAVIDVLKKVVPGIVPVEPDGSKLARAHAVTAYWEAGNVHLPHTDLYSWVKQLTDELTVFPNAPNDDQVDALSQALRHLYPTFNKLNISQSVLDKALGR